MKSVLFSFLLILTSHLALAKHIGCVEHSSLLFLQAKTATSAIRICEETNKYTFFVNGESWAYDKPEFQKELSEKIAHTLSETNWPFKRPLTADVAFWMWADSMVSTPVAKVVVSNRFAHFVFVIPLRKTLLSCQANIHWLGYDFLPLNNGSWLGQVIATPLKGKDTEAKAILFKKGALKIQKMSEDNWLVSVRNWTESQFLNQLKSDLNYDKIFESLAPSPIFENPGEGDLAFRFTINI